jgi:3-methyladenine DNA glycosylase AlkC
MTPLEQFNEEVMREFQDEFKQMFEDLSEDKELYFKHVFNNFITQKLTEHKALILKMVREKAEDSNGYGEFLDDLKTL